MKVTIHHSNPFLPSNHSDIFRETIERNRYLEERNDELERQVDVWTKGTDFSCLAF